MCMGSSTLPALGTAWKAWGKTTPRATQRAAKTSCLVENFCMKRLLSVKKRHEGGSPGRAFAFVALTFDDMGM